MAAKGLSSKTRLNKYGVDLSVLEKIGCRAIEAALTEKEIVVVDEIGSIEMLSPTFCEKIAEALGGPKPFLATIRLKAQPFTSQIKKMSDTRLVVLNKDNFLEVKEAVHSWIAEICAGQRKLDQT